MTGVASWETGDGIGAELGEDDRLAVGGPLFQLCPELFFADSRSPLQ